MTTQTVKILEDLLGCFSPHVGILPQKKEALHMTTRTVKLKGSRRPAHFLSTTRWDHPTEKGSPAYDDTNC